MELITDGASSDTLTCEPRPTGTFALLEHAAVTMARPAREVQREWMRAYHDGILQPVLRGEGHHVANQRVLWGRGGPPCDGEEARVPHREEDRAPEAREALLKPRYRLTAGACEGQPPGEA
ncbi:hypothetical protein HPC50_12285 [Corallococcus exiguus]|uniref:hypothetical protein n=1 Tax=Corallococcus TaxID=83461 RepID=UPI001315A4F1|nr:MULTISPECIES: hypothetical protein [Corallococcus]NPC47851.1 hypothetical protein [Corallococcus exiguus]